jgi:hypothetical protein
METKHLIALMLLIVLTCGGVLAITLSQRLRDFALFGLVFGAIFTERMDVNFLDQYWYRGTVRGIEISLIDILALGLVVASCLTPVYTRRRWWWPAGVGLLVLYFLYCCASVATAVPKIYGVWELTQILRGIFVVLATAMFVRTRRELAIVVLALSSTVLIQTVFGLKQRFLGGIYRVPGTLDHENSLSMYLCTVCPFLLAAALSDWPKWLRWLAGIAAAGGTVTEMLTISRAGLPIFALTMLGVAFFCNTWRITRKKVLVSVTVALAVGLLVFKTWDQIAARYESASLEEEYLNEDAEGRGVYFRWAAAITDDHFFGVGLNNWSYYVSKIYGPRLGFSYEDYDEIQTSPEKADLPSIRYAAPAHSLAALTMGELGIPGLCLLLLVWFRWFYLGAGFLWGRLNPDPMHRLGIGCFFATWGIFLQSITEWTYRQTPLQFTFHTLVGVLASLYYARRHERVREESPAPAGELEIEAEVVPVQS